MEFNWDSLGVVFALLGAVLAAIVSLLVLWLLWR